MTPEALTTADGNTVYIDRRTTERGSLAPFYAVFVDADCETRWGYQCGACDGLDNAMDTMGRILCNDCENMRKADEWDAAQE